MTKAAAHLTLLFTASAVACSSAPSAQEEACARVDAAWSVETSMPASSPAPARGAPRDLSSASKLSLAVYHFNVQYVAGGLRGFPDGTIVEKYDLDEREVEDRIVRGGLEPVLDIYLAHPEFGADIELQAYMVEVIAARHADVLEKMRTLAHRGQIDFDSFHYSDQLYVAYPDRDLEVSLELTKAIFDRAGLPLGRAIFTQEGQFARGQLAIAARHGYEVSILPKNLFTYQVGDAPADANVLYTDASAPEHAVILGGRGFGTEGFELAWTFMDDGEIAFSKAELNPYFGTDYVLDPDRIAEHVAELEAMAASGFVHVTVADAVRVMKARSITPAALPRVFDGTWQPGNTNNLFRWMGGGGLFRTFEADSDVLAANWRARTTVERAERALGAAPSTRVARGLRAAWREVLLAEVSDSTGWNPFRTEIAYSRGHAAAAEALAADTLACAGVTAPVATPPTTCASPGPSLDALGVEVVAPARQVVTTVRACTASAGTLTEISIDVPKLVEREQTLDQTDQETEERTLELRARRTGDDVTLSPALDPAMTSFRLDDYVFDSIGIALPLGVASLGGDRWIIQDLASQRTAVLVTRTSEDRSVLRFRDDTV
ncbi:hypothetical protein L6R52_32135, partial [Myxococcota bacterium]|nr:hypothetical protein [Myxococcota bacterium]